MSILDHVWGQSPAADRVWAQVSGLPPSKAGKRLLMVWQAYIDDSYANDTYVLAGHIATAEQWARLSTEWAELLPRFGTLAKNGKYHFKMAEMAALPERLERVAPFYRLIEKYVSFSISVNFKISDIQRAINRLYVPHRSLDFGKSVNRYIIAFRGIIENLEANFDQIREHVEVELPIDFYFDQQSEKSQILRGWDQYIESRTDSFRAFIGTAPKFEDDTIFLPLQAADLWAWWVREWHESGTPEKMENPDFGPFAAKRKGHLKVHMGITEQTFISVFKSALWDQALLPGDHLYEISYPWNH